MAQRLGITVTTYNRFERGERRPYLDQALAIARTLNVTVEQLTRPPTPEERLQLFQRYQDERNSKTVGESSRAQQIELEHRAAEEVQHDLADHGFPVEPSDAEPGSVVDDAHVTHTPAPTSDDMVAAWSGDDDTDGE